MSLYRRGPYWHYEFMVAGQRFRGSTKQTTRAKAEKVQAVKMASAQDGFLGLRLRIPTLAGFKPEFFKWLDATALKPATRRYYKEGWKVLEGTDLAGMHLNRITRDQVLATPLPGSGSFRNQAIRTLRRMLGRAEESRYIPRAPKLKLAGQASRNAVITGEQEKLLLAHMSPRVTVAYLMMVDGGLRRDEVVRAKIEQIYWNDHRYFVEDGKTEKSRRNAFLSDRLFDALFVHAKDRKQGWLFPSKKAKSGHVHPDSLTHWFEQARTDAGLPADIVLYSARHTFGTILYKRTGNLKLVMDAMGHTNVKTAMIYQHPELELGRQAINANNAERVN